MKTYGRNAVLELLKTSKTVDKILMEKGAQGTLGKIFAEARAKNSSLTKRRSTGSAPNGAIRA